MDMDVQFVWPLTLRGADQGPNRMDMDGSGCTRVGRGYGAVISLHLIHSFPLDAGWS